MQETKPQLIAILLCTLLAGYIVAPMESKWPDFMMKAQIEKGIDLAGGAELTYRALFPSGYPGDRKTDIGKVRDVLANRFQARKGALLEPRITAVGEDQILLQMPGIDRDKLDDYKRLVTTIGRLDLKEVAPREIHEEFNASGTVPAGYEAYTPDSPIVRQDYPYIKTKILVKGSPVITGEDIADASHEPNPRAMGSWMVRFKLEALGAKKFDESAKTLHAQQPRGMIAIIIDSQLNSAPVVESDHYDGEGTITGGFNEQRARELAIVLKSGSLPVPIGKRVEGQDFPKVPEAENFVGPTLGQDSIQRGIWACLISLIGVALFMVIYYRAGGVIAVFGVVINLLFTLALMAIFNATLTLPGIAGLVLTIGMALDANILVLERIREEMQRGKTAMQAFEAGYHRAAATIIDSNLTTLVAAVVMYYFGTGPIQGFAVTLSLGIITTLVAVLWCCKVLQRHLVQNGTITQWKMAQFFRTPNIDFARLARPAVIISLVLMAGSVFIFVKRGESQYGIDIKGGSMLHFAFAQPQPIDSVRKTVSGIRHAVDGREVEKYPDAEIQSVAAAGQGWKSVSGILKTQATEFQLRTVSSDLEGLKKDLQEAFKETLSHEPFEAAEAEPNERLFGGKGAGAALNLYFRATPDFSVEEIDRKFVEAFKDLLAKDETGRPCFLLKALPDPSTALRKVQIILSKEDSSTAKLTEIKEKIRSLGKAGTVPLSADPFIAAGQVGPSVAGELRNKAAWAMIWSWSLMIVYIAIRFSRVAFGVAAVLALIHDAVVAVGFTSLAGWLIPASWGLSFEMNMNTLAAILTIIGFSINDTIVTFDRIRENLGTMKRESFREVINASVNQTLSRTLLTAFTVWVTCAVLYFFTMTSGGGIASFAFPMLMGVIVGSYSTVYIAAPILIWWFKGQRPVAA